MVDGQHQFSTARRAARVCESLAVIFGIIVATSGFVNLSVALGLKKHGFEVRGLKLVNAASAETESVQAGPLEGAILSWCREERWGPISDTVRISFTVNGHTGNLAVVLPYSNSLTDPSYVDKAALHLAHAITEVTTPTLEKHALETYSRAIILGGLAVEPEQKTVRALPQLDVHEEAMRPGDTAGEYYPYHCTTGSQVLRESMWALLAVGSGLVLALSAARTIRTRGLHWMQLVALQAAVSSVLLALSVCDWIAKPREPILDHMRMWFVMVTGVIPLLLCSLYVRLARRCYARGTRVWNEGVERGT